MVDRWRIGWEIDAQNYRRTRAGNREVPLAGNGAMVMTDSYPTSRVGEATTCPLGQSFIAPVEARPTTNSGVPFGLGDPFA